MSRVYLDYLRDMSDNAKRAMGFTAGMDYQTFEKDDKTVYAVIRAVEIIGEAASKISKETQKQHGDIPWADIIGMRNRLIHAYFDIDIERVWDTVQLDIPELCQQLKEVISFSIE